MPESSLVLPTMDGLRDYVERVLCGQDELEAGAFPFTERLIVQSGRPCGVYYCLHGPRRVKFTAVWDAARNAVLFYGSTGERFQTTRLARGPQLEQSLRRAA